MQENNFSGKTIMIRPNKNDLRILSFLNNHLAFDDIKSCTAEGIYTGLKKDLSISKVKKSLTQFLKKGFVELGFKTGKANSYYITQKGIDELNLRGVPFQNETVSS